MTLVNQSFERFLKQTVGGLFTVYAKCKRLRIFPISCNVEQVSTCLSYQPFYGLSIYLSAICNTCLSYNLSDAFLTFLPFFVAAFLTNLLLSS